MAHFSKIAVACVRGFVCDVAFLCPQNEEMVTEGELRSNLDDSEKVRELQDKVADLKAEVHKACIFFVSCVTKYAQMLHSAAHIFACAIAHCLSIDCTYLMQHGEGGEGGRWSKGVTATVAYGREVICLKLGKCLFVSQSTLNLLL